MNGIESNFAIIIVLRSSYGMVLGVGMTILETLAYNEENSIYRIKKSLVLIICFIRS